MTHLRQTCLNRTASRALMHAAGLLRTSWQTTRPCSTPQQHSAHRGRTLTASRVQLSTRRDRPSDFQRNDGGSRAIDLISTVHKKTATKRITRHCIIRAWPLSTLGTSPLHICLTCWHDYLGHVEQGRHFTEHVACHVQLSATRLPLPASTADAKGETRRTPAPKGGRRDC